MTIVSEMKQPSSVLDMLMKKPEKSEEILEEIEGKYNKLFGAEVEELEEKKEGEKEEGMEKS